LPTTPEAQLLPSAIEAKPVDRAKKPARATGTSTLTKGGLFLGSDALSKPESLDVAASDVDSEGRTE
jgi:hypothetical protein